MIEKGSGIMQVLEGILSEIDDLIVHSAWPNMNLVEKEKVEEIIRSHMEDARKDLQTAISAIEELQRYKEIRTVEQVKNQKHNLVVAYNMLGKYQQIGTLEECREAREKQQAIPAVQMSLLDFPEVIP